MVVVPLAHTSFNGTYGCHFQFDCVHNILLSYYGIVRQEMNMQTYKETIGRYRIVRHDELPEGHKQAYRDRGINPDDNWSLVWSFHDEAAAEKTLANCQEDAAPWETFKLIDHGETTIIERPVW